MNSSIFESKVRFLQSKVYFHFTTDDMLILDFSLKYLCHTLWYVRQKSEFRLYCYSGLRMFSMTYFLYSKLLRRFPIDKNHSKGTKLISQTRQLRNEDTKLIFAKILLKGFGLEYVIIVRNLFQRKRFYHSIHFTWRDLVKFSLFTSKFNFKSKFL